MGNDQHHRNDTLHDIILCCPLAWQRVQQMALDLRISCVLLNSFTVWRRKLQSNVNVKVQRRNSRNKIDVGRPTLEKVTEQLMELHGAQKVKGWTMDMISIQYPSAIVAQTRGGFNDLFFLLNVDQKSIVLWWTIRSERGYVIMCLLTDIVGLFMVRKLDCVVARDEEAKRSSG